MEGYVSDFIRVVLPQVERIVMTIQISSVSGSGNEWYKFISYYRHINIHINTVQDNFQLSSMRRDI